MEFDLVWLGFLKRTYGKDGGLKVELHESILDRIEPGTFLFIDLDGNRVPFKISELEFKSDVIIYFEDISTPEEASLFTGSELFIEKKHLDQHLIKALSGEGLEYSFLKGYTLIHPEIGKIGTIQSVEAYPQQEMAVIKHSGEREVLIPLNTEMITEVDEKEKQIIVNFPEDILNL